MSLAAQEAVAQGNSQLASFHAHLKSSRRILALAGAGLSAASGLPTFRGSGGLWREFDATELATPEAFATDPSLVWQFYSARRHAALKAKPNKGHYALAELARRRRHEFLLLTQNVDGLSARAHHPPDRIVSLHGDLFTLKCTSFYCNYKDVNNFKDPLTPALADSDDLSRPPKQIPTKDLPLCPQCHSGLLRPGVVWFGEPLPIDAITKADDFIISGDVDLILVIGTSESVWPAAGYVERIKMLGGKVAVFNIEQGQQNNQADWVFNGDAAVNLPLALEPVIDRI